MDDSVHEVHALLDNLNSNEDQSMAWGHPSRGPNGTGIPRANAAEVSSYGRYGYADDELDDYGLSFHIWLECSYSRSEKTGAS